MQNDKNKKNIKLITRMAENDFVNVLKRFRKDLKVGLALSSGSFRSYKN